MTFTSLASGVGRTCLHSGQSGHQRPPVSLDANLVRVPRIWVFSKFSGFSERADRAPGRATMPSRAFARGAAGGTLPPGGEPGGGFFAGTDKTGAWARRDIHTGTLLLCVVLQADGEGRPATAVDGRSPYEVNFENHQGEDPHGKPRTRVRRRWRASGGLAARRGGPCLRASPTSPASSCAPSRSTSTAWRSS